ncbi:MAG: hypothetical protein ACD_49C00029G0017 [uncultured bacterium (gcode 4)]|uniref:Uncharacterized protein n=1 Tax=uncultured bacterium (gcode 4) TaxID=1234023 RepID=K2BWH5_9BACT|nr:MAG: hypothetical protein ACD_49C00029G0017 [uncultured bacterium (gcode 4)]
MNKISNTPREHKKNNKIIRISVANLASDINWRIVGIVNKKRLNLWMKKISFIWWSAILFNKKIIEELGGFDFDENNTKFKISADMLEHIIQIFSKANSFLYERAILRELIEELSNELIWNMTEPILSENECYEFNSKFIGTVYSEWYWSSIKRKILTKYIWHIFSLNCPAHIIQKLEQHEIIYFLDEQDFERKKTHDWFSLWSNIMTIKEFLDKNKQ